MRLPVLEWIRSYPARYIGADITAGVVVAALAMPQALGYAGIAGVPVLVGLYSIPLALIAYAIFGSSRAWWSARSPRCRCCRGL